MWLGNPRVFGSFRLLRHEYERGTGNGTEWSRLDSRDEKKKGAPNEPRYSCPA